MMDGLVVINKEKDMTSHDVVGWARKILKTKRIGHLGTLDPNATGVLVLCIGDACKLVPFLENDSKEYLAEVILGIDTNTYDITGEICASAEVNLTNQIIEKILTKFLGEINQYPPIYSAIKIKGKKLYQYARNNEVVEIPARKVVIHSIEYGNDLHYSDGYYRFTMLVKVSKGTYIRSLCHDIGIELGCYATMGDLVRTKSGKFTLDDAIKVSELTLDNLKLISLLDAIDYPKIAIDDENLLKRVENGMPLSLDTLNSDEQVVAFSYRNRLCAIYENTGKELIARRIWK